MNGAGARGGTLVHFRETIERMAEKVAINNAYELHPH